MASDLVEAVRGALDPVLEQPISELGILRDVEEGRRGSVTVKVAVPTPDWPGEPLGEAIAVAAKAHGATDVAVDVVVMSDADREALGRHLENAEKHRVGATGSRTRVIAVSSGKGGVGKSSVTANTAVALAQAGHSVGVLDADVWGFSIPKMLGVDAPPHAIGSRIVAPRAHGVRVISMDYFVGPDQAVIWRGPMLHKALEQFLGDVFWGEPDFLLIDMPPGTGDVAISISQFAPRAQSLVVTTPQVTAQRVARRAAAMAEKVNQEVVGVVENMSWFTGDDGTRYEIFGSGGGAALAEDLGVPLLGQIPLLPALRLGADEGTPVALAAPDSEAAKAFDQIASRLVELRPRVRTHPELVIE